MSSVTRPVQVRKGYWADHEYHRRNVEFGVEEFEGWNRIISLVEKGRRVGEGRVPPSGVRDAGLIAELFIGGFRAGEASREEFPSEDGHVVTSGVRKEQVKVIKDSPVPHLLFDNVMALKGHRKIPGSDFWDDPVNKTGHHYLTRRLPVYRMFPVPLSEPKEVLDAFLEHVDKVKEGQWLFPLTPTRVWQIVKDVDPTVWPHWFRAQRAAQLAREYKWDLHKISEWFQWKDLKTAARYASMGYGGLLESLPVGPVTRIL